MCIYNVVIACIHVYLKNVQGLSVRCGSRHSLESVSRIQLAHMFQLRWGQTSAPGVSEQCAVPAVLDQSAIAVDAIAREPLPPQNYRNYGLEVLALRPGTAGGPGKWARVANPQDGITGTMAQTIPELAERWPGTTGPADT